MWNKKVLEKLEFIHKGQSGSEKERNYLNNLMCFYANDEHGEHYCLGYNLLMDYYTGKKRNPFTWIGYELFSSRGYEPVFSLNASFS